MIDGWIDRIIFKGKRFNAFAIRFGARHRISSLSLAIVPHHTGFCQCNKARKANRKACIKSWK
jgi:hypothetical protein